MYHFPFDWPHGCDCDCDDCHDMIAELMTDEDAGEEVSEDGGDHYHDNVGTKVCRALPQSIYPFPSSST